MPLNDEVAVVPGATKMLLVTFGTFVNSVLDGSTSIWSWTVVLAAEFSVAPKTTPVFVELPCPSGVTPSEKY